MSGCVSRLPTSLPMVMVNKWGVGLVVVTALHAWTQTLAPGTAPEHSCHLLEFCQDPDCTHHLRLQQCISEVSWFNKQQEIRYVYHPLYRHVPYTYALRAVQKSQLPSNVAHLPDKLQALTVEQDPTLVGTTACCKARYPSTSLHYKTSTKYLARVDTLLYWVQVAKN